MDNFDLSIRNLLKFQKPYIVRGRQKIEMSVHRTKCSLYLIDEDNGQQASLKRAATDLYKGSSNFSDLPELPSEERDQQMSSMNLFRSKNLTNIVSKMVYEEDLQMQLYMHKKVDVFKEHFQNMEQAQALRKRLDADSISRRLSMLKLPLPNSTNKFK